MLSVGYRLSPQAKFPAPHDDCVAAYRRVVSHRAQLGADLDRLAVGGDSAGANFAATTAIEVAREGLPLRLQFLLYPVTDFTGTHLSRVAFGEGFFLTEAFIQVSTDRYLRDRSQRDDPAASPLFAEIPTGLASAYIATGGFDPLRDEGEADADRLEAAGVRAIRRRVGDQLHGFMNVVGAGRSSRAAVREAAGVLRAELA